MLADKEPGNEPEIDVDELDDAAFAELKGKMAGETEQDEAVEAKKDEPATAEAKTQEPAPDANKADDDDPKTETVPHGQFHRERERRKEAERLKAEADERFTKLAARVAELTAVKEQPKTEEQKTDEPDPANPLEQIAWLVKEVREGRMSREEAQKQAREEGERQVFANNIKAVEDQFKAANPDYETALQFAAKSRDDELALLYPQMSADQRRNYVLEEWNALSRNAIATQQNPAEMVYKFAQMRGYRKAEPQQQEQQPDVVEQITKQEETRKAALSLGKTGGGVTQTGAISPEQLLDMTDEEFAAYKAKYGSVAKAFAA